MEFWDIQYNVESTWTPMYFHLFPTKELYFTIIQSFIPKLLKILTKIFIDNNSFQNLDIIFSILYNLTGNFK